MIGIRQLPVANRYCMAAGLSETPNWYQHKCQKHRTTSLISFKTSKSSIKSSWRFECESAGPNAPTKIAPMSVLRPKPVILPAPEDQAHCSIPFARRTGTGDRVWCRSHRVAGLLRQRRAPLRRRQGEELSNAPALSFVDVLPISVVFGKYHMGHGGFLKIDLKDTTNIDIRYYSPHSGANGTSRLTDGNANALPTIAGKRRRGWRPAVSSSSIY
jgi:hypothetical protein